MANRGFTLISSLVTIALIAMLAVVFMYGGFGPQGSKRKDKLGQTVPGAAILATKDQVCRSNLEQCRQTALELRLTNPDEELATSLDELKLGYDMTHCPIQPREAYIYDPTKYAQTQNRKDLVRCPHPGHEKY